MPDVIQAKKIGLFELWFEFVLKLPVWVCLAALSLPVLFLNLPNLTHTFVSDDWYILQEVAGQRTFPTTFLAGSGYVRPVGMLTWAILYHLFDIEPLPYYLLALLLHLGNVWLVFAIVNKLLSARFASFTAALAFGTFHLGWEPTTWLSSAFFDVQCAFFMLLAFRLFLDIAPLNLEVTAIGKERAKSRKSEILTPIFSVICFGLATFSKETGILLLPIYLFYDLWNWRLTRRKVWQNLFLYGLMALVLLIFFALHYWFNPGANTTDPIQPANFLGNIGFYLKGLLLPLYGYNLSGFALLRHELKLGLWLLPIIPVLIYIIFSLMGSRNKPTDKLRSKRLRSLDVSPVGLLVPGLAWVVICSLATTTQKYTYLRFLYVADIGIVFVVAALILLILNIIKWLYLNQTALIATYIAIAYIVVAFSIAGMLEFEQGRNLYTRASDFTRHLTDITSHDIASGVTTIVLVNIPREIESANGSQANLFYDGSNIQIAISLQPNFHPVSIQVLRTEDGSKLGYDVTGNLIQNPLPVPTIGNVIIRIYRSDISDFSIIETSLKSSP